MNTELKEDLQDVFDYAEVIQEKSDCPYIEAIKAAISFIHQKDSEYILNLIDDQLRQIVSKLGSISSLIEDGQAARHE